MKPVAWASCSACVVLPTPGVPVIMMLGFLRAMVAVLGECREGVRVEGRHRQVGYWTGKVIGVWAVE